jgi:hypothetical protein
MTSPLERPREKHPHIVVVFGEQNSRHVAIRLESSWGRLGLARDDIAGKRRTLACAIPAGDGGW